MNKLYSGWKEISHTADWSIHVWAPDLQTLLLESAKAVSILSGIQIAPDQDVKKINFCLPFNDLESLLVDFLPEFLFFVQHDYLCMEHIQFEIRDTEVRIVSDGLKITSYSKEIKAVTYHNLKVKYTDAGCETIIVFDV